MLIRAVEATSRQGDALCGGKHWELALPEEGEASNSCYVYLANLSIRRNTTLAILRALTTRIHKDFRKRGGTTLQSAAR